MSLLVVGIAAAFTLTRQDGIDSDATVAWLRGFGQASPLLFVGLYVVATVLFLPGGLLTLAGGAIFGTIPGALLSLTGATIGATFAFLLARYVASGWAAARLQAKLPTLMDGIESEGWKFVGLVRLVPILPFNALNYALGLTPIRLVHYVWASFAFMLPGALAYSYLGHLGKEAAAGRVGPIRTALIIIGVISLMSLLSMFIKRFRKVPPSVSEINAIDAMELNRRLGSKDLVVIDVRNPDEFSSPLGHIENAINFPLPSLVDRLQELNAYRKRKVVVVCLSDKRSTQAIQYLRDAGFEDLILLRGGMKEWTANHLPVAVC
ncbi:MAG: VTT domain-containing protein [Gammaproteobacteria bacterium]